MCTVRGRAVCESVGNANICASFAYHVLVSKIEAASEMTEMELQTRRDAPSAWNVLIDNASVPRLMS